MEKEPDLVTVSSKGQIVIPQALRRVFGITPKTKLLAYGGKNAIVLRKIKIPNICREWGEIFDIAKKKKLKLTARDVQREIESYRREKKLKG